MTQPIAVGDRPVFNLLLLAYGLPALFAALLFLVSNARRAGDSEWVAGVAGIALLDPIVPSRGNRQRSVIQSAIRRHLPHLRLQTRASASGR